MKADVQHALTRHLFLSDSCQNLLWFNQQAQVAVLKRQAQYEHDLPHPDGNGAPNGKHRGAEAQLRPTFLQSTGRACTTE